MIYTKGGIFVKTSLTILSTKLIQKASKLAGKGGSTTPGVFARKLNPSILMQLKNNVEHIIFITGTNGKTTTSNVLATILEANNNRVINNKEGANLITGITTAFVAAQNIRGNKKFDYAVIEIDEGSIERVLKEVTPEMFVFTNLFRDQVDRFGTEKDLAETLKQLLKHKNCKLVLNANDPYVSHIASDHKSIYYGFEPTAYNFDNIDNGEHIVCPCCDGELQYNSQFYAHLGDYVCPQCGYQMQTPNCRVSNVTDGVNPSLTMNNTKFTSSLEGGYNAFNLLAAITAAQQMGLTTQQIQKGLDALALENGRMERLTINGKPALLNLAKNTAGLNVTLSAAATLPGTKNIYIGVNNTPYDGEDSSWVNDANYTLVADDTINTFFCGGSCANDVKQALLASGIAENRIKIANDNALSKELTVGADSVLIIPNYTMLEPVRKQFV